MATQKKRVINYVSLLNKVPDVFRLRENERAMRSMLDLNA